jgi:hypothetical protein
MLWGYSYTNQHVFGFVASHGGFTFIGVVAASQNRRVFIPQNWGGWQLTSRELLAVKQEGVGQQDRRMFRNKHVDFGQQKRGENQYIYCKPAIPPNRDNRTDLSQNGNGGCLWHQQKNAFQNQ